MNNTFLSARWENLIMANYEVSPELLRPYLPHGVDIDFYENKTYVSLVGFMFKNTSLFKIPIPFFGTFEEINLRFYVKRMEGDEIKRGVVFINETVPHRIVAWVANRLYKEHYITIPTKNEIDLNERIKTVKYEWKINGKWNHISVNAAIEKKEMLAGSLEEFIFEHYYGYTKMNNTKSQEYKVNHPRWLVNMISDYSIHCNFNAMYGNDFSFLNSCEPNSVIIAEGSEITVDWKRITF
jgi:hypothetical protein